MTESLSRGESSPVVRSGVVGTPPDWASDLFAQYGPCPECGEETVTYSREFEDSDLACYTCGHWLGFHEATAREPASGRGDPELSAAQREQSTGGITGFDALLKRIRSLF